MRSRHLAVLGLLIAAGVADAQQPLASASDLRAAASRRFPQPVRVGDLARRAVLQPLESQRVLGRVRNLVKRDDGTIAVVIDYGGVFGFFARPIAVPVDGMALLGEHMAVLGFTPEQLDRFQTFDAAGSQTLAPDAVIRVGLVGPFH